MIGETGGAMQERTYSEDRLMAAPGAKGAAYKTPAQMVVQQAENGWVVSVHGGNGQVHWVAKSENELAALMKQLAEDCAQREYHV